VKRLLISTGLFSLLCVGVFADEQACSIRNQGANCTPVNADKTPTLKLLPGENPKTAKKSSGTRKPQSDKKTQKRGPTLRSGN
jgi:hypothetical protein